MSKLKALPGPVFANIMSYLPNTDAVGDACHTLRFRLMSCRPSSVKVLNIPSNAGELLAAHEDLQQCGRDVDELFLSDIDMTQMDVLSTNHPLRVRGIIPKEKSKKRRSDQMDGDVSQGGTKRG